jgi:acyl carrier protein
MTAGGMVGPDARAATRAGRATALRDFLRTIQKPDRMLDGVDETTSLVEADLIDSLAVLQIVTYLEDTYGIDFVEKGVDPGELMSVGGILDLIERETA